MPVASCFRSGEIVVGARVPRGALELCRAPGRSLRQIVSVIARHAYDGSTLLVPGVPEAENDQEALTAARSFRDQIQRRLARLTSQDGGLL